MLYFDPEKDGDLINKLEAKLAKLSQNSYQLEKPLNLFPRDQLALISDEGNKLEQFKERVQAALERNNYEELKGLVEEISALKIMQVYPSRSSPFPSEREAWKLIFEYHLLKRVLYYQIILSSEGGNTLEQFKERVQAALESNDEKELESLAQEISALKIMQVYLSPSSPFSSEIQAYELRVEYDKLKRVLYYQIILITEGGNTLEQFRRRVQAALESNDEKELESLAQEISALKIMQVFPISSSRVLSEREAYELKAEYQRMIEMIKEAQRRLRKLGPST